jgi:hypothetical protein
MTQLKDRDYKHIAQRVLGIMQEQRERRRSVVDCESVQDLVEENTFCVYRTDTQAVLAKNIKGYEMAKNRANRFRQAMNLRWDQISFKAERQTPTPKRFGVSPSGRSFTNARGDTGRVDYANRFNRSKGSRFKGYTDFQGNFHDLSET